MKISMNTVNFRSFNVKGNHDDIANTLKLYKSPDHEYQTEELPNSMRIEVKSNDKQEKYQSELITALFMQRAGFEVDPSDLDKQSTELRGYSL